MAKRKNQEGCYGTKIIHEDEYKFYRFPDGHYVYARKSKELEEKKKAYQEKIDNGNVANNNLITFDDYCKEWLKTRNGYISDRVFDDYESIINTRIAKYPIGTMQIKSLTVDAFSQFFKEMSKKYSKASIDKTWVVCKQVLQYGIEEKDIPAINIAKIKRPKETEVKVKKKKIPFITKEDMDLLIEELESGRYGDGSKVLIFIMHSGLRISEAIELKWKFVLNDFSNIRIEESRTKTIQRDKNLEPIKNGSKNAYNKVTKGTKSADGQRIIPMSQKAQEILQYFDRIKENDYVFISSTGNPFDARAVARTLEHALKNSKCSRKDYTPHCLRHGFGSVLIQNGVDIKIVSELLGHSDVAFTYNTYIGTTQKDKENALRSVFG